MRWVHKQTIAFLIAVLLPVAIGIWSLPAHNKKPTVEISTTTKI
jgi:hypothetical protein